ncbi:hypothetical protein Acor_27300 [Acrocarpospora corrugata]|uniref:Thioesterase domain-containing protein n=1 Tax=Acrocarpospora corrugata TaxID=35763 RepID=A0A5M3VVZ0_9ACTN|nr:hypothetical protein [Acrocarpospora corrugata]GES00666.1 hypothetical protein Acor_27300 [Acrocarpospora corrugata]
MLEKIVEGDLPPVIVVDFAMFSVADTMTGLMGVPGSGRAVYRVDAVQDLEIHGALSIAELAALYAGEIGKLASPPAAVLGYCSAATLALALADRLGERPEVILVEPTWLTTDMIGQELANLRAGLGTSGEPPAEISPASVLGTLTGDLTGKLAAEGMSEAEVETCVSMLTLRYDAWFGFLFATEKAAVPMPVTPVSLVVGGDSDRGPAPGWTAAQCSPVRVEVPSGELLRSPAARQKIFQLIDRA